MPNDLMALAARCEQAPANDLPLLMEVWAALFPRSAFKTGRDCDHARNTFRALCQAGGWTDAAIMLLPTDGSMSLLDAEMSWEPAAKAVWPAMSIRWYPPHKAGPNWHALVVSAATLPLTIAAAALTARSRAAEA